MPVTIIGAGAMASAIAHLLSRTTTVQVLARKKERAAVIALRDGGRAGNIGDPLLGDVVILAVPWAAVPAITALYATAWDARIVVDATNPDGPSAAADTPDDSTARALQAALPRASVVKAFNTTLAGTLTSEDQGEGLPTVLVAGDDVHARTRVVDLVRGSDAAAVDVGPLCRAVELEALARLQAGLLDRGAISARGGFALRY
jgi:8-hydroxy-5-deazaflavin:NADPH oxidoreductase